MNTLKMVKQFHDAFGVPTPDKPDLTDTKNNSLRLNLLTEELFELEEALFNEDIVGVLDALTDIQYVLDGTYLAFGLAGLKEEAFAEVHRSNMSKLGVDGKPIYRDDGKVLKGPTYFKPNLVSIVNKV